MNCLQYCLDFWEQNKHYTIFYNSNHAIIVVGDSIEVENGDLVYLPLKDYGAEYFINAFNLNEHYTKILYEYLNQ